jgi:DNA-directed RNA polymerase I subunit RPA49
MSRRSCQIRDQRIALGQEFGSKRSKAVIAQQLSSQVDSKALEGIAAQIFDNVKTATANIPTQGMSSCDLTDVSCSVRGYGG